MGKLSDMAKQFEIKNKKSQIPIENIDESILGLDYNVLVNSSDFQRLIIKVVKIILPESFKNVLKKFHSQGKLKSINEN